MQGRRTKGQIVQGFCALFVGISLLAGCKTTNEAQNRHWTPIARSADVTVPKPPLNTSQPASRPAVSLSASTSQSPFADYDRALVDSVLQRWYAILNNKTYPTGEVVVQFVLTFTGNVTDLQVIKSTVNDRAAAICQKAIHDSAPFPSWTADTRRRIGDKRTITFNFYFAK